ncbi:MAG: hypothetical protein ACYC2G_02325 [Gemmatimonadaceae bacterium]
MRVRQRVARERGTLRTLVLAGGAAVGLAAGALLLAAGTAILGGGRWITLPAVLPFVVWLLVLVAFGAVVWATVRWLGRSMGEGQVARAVEGEQRLRSGSLVGVLEVPDSALARRAEQRLGERLAGVDGSLAPALQRRTRRQGGTALAAAVLAVLLLVAATGSSGDGWTALAHPARAWAGTLLPEPRLSGLPPAVVRGESLTVVIEAPGRRAVTLWHRATGGGWRQDRLLVDGGRAALALASVDADLMLVASDGRASSDTARVAVTDRPFLADVAIRAIYPAYLDRPPELLVTGEPARVPRGTELQLSGTSTTMLRTVRLAAEGDTMALTITDRRFAGRLLAEHSGTWRWLAEGRDGGAPETPAALELTVLPDSAPEVAIVTPDRDSLVLPGDRVALVARATDDHGLAGVVVRSWRRRADGGQDAEVAQRTSGGGQPQWAGELQLDLASRELQPGDELRVVVSATDDSPWRQTTTSRELVLRVPTLAEQRTNVRTAADAAVASALAAAAAQRQLTQRTEDASRARDRGDASRQQNSGGSEAGQERSLSFESAERAKALAAEQRKLAAEIERMREAAQRLEKQLDQAGAMDDDLRARLREAQQLMKEALTPRLAEQLRKLEQSAQQLQPEATRQALADLAEQQRQLREQLARGAEMLRRAALEGSMETLRDEAVELAKAQQELAQSPTEGSRSQAERRPEAGDSGERQSSASTSPSARSSPPTPEELARRSEQLSEAVKRLQQRLAEQKATTGERRAEEAARHASASAEALRQGMEQGRRETGEQGSRAQQPQQPQQGQQGQQGQLGRQRQGGQQGQSGQQGQQGQQAQQGQQPGGMRQAAGTAAAEMQRTADQLAAARSEQVQEWKQELTAELDRSINELQQMAREQRSLEQRARKEGSGEDLRAPQAALQQGVQQTGQRLQQEGRKSSLLSQRSQQAVAQAQQQVRQATQQASQAAGQQGGARAAQNKQAADAMAGAAGALDQAAALLALDRSRANSSQSASGMAEMLAELQKLAGQQGSLNSQAAGLIPGQGRQPSPAMQAQARELARQQRAIARDLEALGDPDGTGSADAMADEARRLAQALEGGGADPNTVNRQQRLFRRMLDAGRTLEKDEVDESGRRRGETARSTDRFMPPSGAVSGRAAQRYAVPTWNELRQLSPDERRIVIEYFRRLNADPAGALATPPSVPAPAGTRPPPAR